MYSVEIGWISFSAVLHKKCTQGNGCNWWILLTFSLSPNNKVFVKLTTPFINRNCAPNFLTHDKKPRGILLTPHVLHVWNVQWIRFKRIRYILDKLNERKLFNMSSDCFLQITTIRIIDYSNYPNPNYSNYW